MGETPQRMCVACRRRRDQHALLRLTTAPDAVRLDAGRRSPGRGAYLCPDPDCIEMAARRDARALRRALRAASGAGVDDALAAARRDVVVPAGRDTADDHRDARDDARDNVRSKTA